MLFFSTYAIADNTNITIFFFSSDGLPVTNVTVSMQNVSANGETINSSSTGNVTFYNIPYDLSYIFNATFPSSAYASVVTSVCKTSVMLGESGSILVNITNTLGEFLEAQDCDIYTTEQDNTNIIARYDTSCTYEDEYVDDGGNWATVTKCPLSNSRGQYPFTFPVTEDLGYFYGDNYTVYAVCNGKETSCNFITALPRRVDMEKTEAQAKNWAGIVFTFFILSLFAIFLIVILMMFYRKFRGSH